MVPITTILKLLLTILVQILNKKSPIFYIHHTKCPVQCPSRSSFASFSIENSKLSSVNQSENFVSGGQIVKTDPALLFSMQIALNILKQCNFQESSTIIASLKADFSRNSEFFKVFFPFLKHCIALLFKVSNAKNSLQVSSKQFSSSIWYLGVIFVLSFISVCMYTHTNLYVQKGMRIF